MKAALAMAIVLGATGCAQLFGLDETHVAGGDDVVDVDASGIDSSNASVDASEDLPACGAPFECDDRICGHLVDFRTGQPIADPSGAAEPCADGATTPPCSFTISMHDYATIEDDNPVSFGTVDTCGRITVDDPGSAGNGWAVIVDDAAGEYARSAAVMSPFQYLFASDVQPTMPIIDVGSTSLVPNGAWLARAFDTQTLDPLAGKQFTLDGTSPSGATYYFSDNDPTTHQSIGGTSTGANGSAVLLNASGNLQILGCGSGDPLDVRPIQDLYLLRGLVC